MTHRNVLRTAVVAIALAVSCQVYDSSLVDDAGGPDSAGSGDSGGSAGNAAGASLRGGAAGLAENGGLSDAGGKGGMSGQGGTVSPELGGGPSIAGAGMSDGGRSGAEGGTSGSAGTAGATGGRSGTAGGNAAGAGGTRTGGGATGAGGTRTGGSAAGAGGTRTGGGATGAGGTRTGGSAAGAGGSAGATSPSGSGAGGGGGSSASGVGGSALSTGGSASTGGALSTGGSAGVTGSGGSSVATENGCANLSVPLLATTHKARFVITLANSMNFSYATISMRVYVKAGVGGALSNYVQDSDFDLLGNSAPAKLNALSGWQTLVWNVGAQGPGSTGITLSDVTRVGIEINAAADATWSNPTLVYVDSIKVSSPTLSFLFDSSSSISPMPSKNDAPLQALWPNAFSEDTTTSNVALGWLASCP